MTTDLDEPLTDEPDEVVPGRDNLTRVLLAIIAVCVLAVAVAGGFVWGRHGRNTTGLAGVSATSVDAGFARDMSTHHTQAVTMAGYERDDTTNPLLKEIAFDIESEQEFQIGEMQGWLDVWGLSRTSTEPQMHWMVGHSLEPDGLMPGIATEAQITQLESSHGKVMDILFLQLMINHHRGGIPMAQYAAQHATQPYVRDLAAGMVTAQSNEIIQMEQLLTQLGGKPLPPPG